MPDPLQAVYYATKDYVTFLGNAIAEELRDTKITITNLMPGATETEFAAVSGMDKITMFHKTAIARSVASGLMTSQKIMISMIPLTPKKMVLKQVRQMQEVNE